MSKEMECPWCLAGKNIAHRDWCPAPRLVKLGAKAWAKGDITDEWAPGGVELLRAITPAIPLLMQERDNALEMHAGAEAALRSTADALDRAEEAKDSLARQLTELQALRTEENRELRKMDQLKAERHELNKICIEQREAISNQAAALRRLATAHVWED